MNKVFTVEDYWDGCLLGIAEYSGSPHIYEKIFDQAQDDYIGWYFLTPITLDLYIAAMSNWDKWCHWRKRFDDGVAQPPFRSELDLIAEVKQLPLFHYKKCQGTFHGDWQHTESMSVSWIEF